MQTSPAVRVGVFVFIALVAFAVVAAFLEGYRVLMAGYPITVMYDNIQGLTKGSQVRMAGVTIGVVEKPQLDRYQRAIVPLRINEKYRIPKGSKFVLRIALMIGDKYIDVIPDRSSHIYLRPGDKVIGEVPPGLDDLLPEARTVMTKLEAASDNVNKLAAEATVAIRNVSKVVGDPELQFRLRRSLANVEYATAHLEIAMSKLAETGQVVCSTSKTIRSTVESQQVNVAEIVDNVKAASESLKAFTCELEMFAAKGNIQEDLSATLAAARETAQSLERSTASLEELVTSPELQQDVKDTVKGAKEAVAEARVVIDRVGKVFGKPAVVKRPEISTRETNLQAFYQPSDERFKAILQTSLPLPDSRFVRLGIYDLGEANSIIVMPGQPLNGELDLRYGLYASKLGVGLDYNPSEKFFGSADLYGSQHARLDVQACYKLGTNWGLMLGVDKLFWDNEIIYGIRISD